MPFPQTGETSTRKIIQSIQELWQGRSNAGGQFTCALSESETVVRAPNCGLSSRVFVSPRHANAAAELAAGTCYVSAVAQGQFTFTHDNSVVDDRTFDYEVRG
jgi:hypothetical protein